MRQCTSFKASGSARRSSVRPTWVKGLESKSKWSWDFAITKLLRSLKCIINYSIRYRIVVNLAIATTTVSTAAITITAATATAATTTATIIWRPSNVVHGYDGHGQLRPDPNLHRPGPKPSKQRPHFSISQYHRSVGKFESGNQRFLDREPL